MANVFRIRASVLFLASGLVQQVLHLLYTGFADVSGGISLGHTHGVLTWPLPQPQPDGHHAVESCCTHMWRRHC